jgi:hypothetical protein
LSTELGGIRQNREHFRGCSLVMPPRRRIVKLASKIDHASTATALRGLDVASMKNLGLAHCANVTTLKSEHRQSSTVSTDEFNLARIPIRIHVHDSADISAHQPVLGNVARQDDSVVFLMHLMDMPSLIAAQFVHGQ